MHTVKWLKFRQRARPLQIRLPKGKSFRVEFLLKRIKENKEYTQIS